MHKCTPPWSNAVPVVRVGEFPGWRYFLAGMLKWRDSSLNASGWPLESDPELSPGHIGYKSSEYLGFSLGPSVIATLGRTPQECQIFTLFVMSYVRTFYFHQKQLLPHGTVSNGDSPTGWSYLSFGPILQKANCHLHTEVAQDLVGGSRFMLTPFTRCLMHLQRGKKLNCPLRKHLYVQRTILLWQSQQLVPFFKWKWIPSFWVSFKIGHHPI